MIHSRSKLKCLINYLFIFLTINYNLLVKFVINIDSTGYALILMSFLVLATNFGDLQKIQSKKPILFWLIWCIYACLNYYLRPHHIDISFFLLYRKIFIPLIVMSVVVLEFNRNPFKLIWCCFITHISFFLLGFYFDSGILFLNLGEENELGNAYAIISSFSLFYLIILYNLKQIKFQSFIIVLLLVIIALSMSGTRKAFGAGIIFFVFWIISQFNPRHIKSWIFVAIFVLLGLWGYNYLIENTYIGYRMEILDKQQEEYLYGNIPDFLGVLGDRAPLYYFGILTFFSNPIFGVGLAQAYVNGIYIHSEYVAQLADNGIIGFMLFILMYLWILKHLIIKIRNDKKIGLSIFSGLVTLLFLFVTAWAWEFPQYFICAGVLIGYCQNKGHLMTNCNIR